MDRIIYMFPSSQQQKQNALKQNAANSNPEAIDALVNAPLTQASTSDLHSNQLLITDPLSVKQSQRSLTRPVGQGMVAATTLQMKKNAQGLVPTSAPIQGKSLQSSHQSLIKDTSPLVTVPSGSLHQNQPIVSQLGNLDPKSLVTTSNQTRPQQASTLNASPSQSVVTLNSNVQNALTPVQVPAHAPIIMNASDLPGETLVLMTSDEAQKLPSGTLVLIRTKDAKGLDNTFQVRGDRFVSKNATQSTDPAAMTTFIDELDNKDKGVCVGVRVDDLPKPANIQVQPVGPHIQGINQGTKKAAEKVNQHVQPQPKTVQDLINTNQANDYVVARADEVPVDLPVRVQIKDVKNTSTPVVQLGNAFVTQSAATGMTPQQANKLLKTQQPGTISQQQKRAQQKRAQQQRLRQQALARDEH